ncbi:hypothetical protein OCU04_000701 [Sclerotinia nivalis]|uniref:Uncharacterized protein n=1 Tax=Sclerotinia nivalis TaxID=352851 RepID=A0A9X0DNN8_9HELO|nr:hypothetical protein OCU04_000701 [Sclerotinia nivalis]
MTITFTGSAKIESNAEPSEIVFNHIAMIVLVETPFENMRGEKLENLTITLQERAPSLEPSITLEGVFQADVKGNLLKGNCSVLKHSNCAIVGGIEGGHPGVKEYPLFDVKNACLPSSTRLRSETTIALTLEESLVLYLILTID